MSLWKLILSIPQSKGILKRRIFVRNDKTAQTTLTKLLQDSGDCCIANMCKRCVTFDETITIKNDEDLVVRKPLKLELVIDNWKSNGTETHTETIQPDPGIVKRLVEEFNTIEEVSYCIIKNNIPIIPMVWCTNMTLVLINVR